jgi:hypothetical protein
MPKEIFFDRFTTHGRGCGLLQFSNSTFLVSLVLSLTVPVKFRSCISGRFYLRAHLSFAHTVPKIQFMYSQEKELRGLSPKSYILVYVSDLYIPRIGPHIWLQKNRQTHIMYFIQRC